MKKIFIFIIILVFPLFSCFQDTGSVIRLSITNTGSSSILHVIAYDGDAVVEQKSFDTSKAIRGEFFIPSDITVTFVVLGENSSGLVEYHGANIVKQEGNDAISITINLVDINTALNPEYEWINPYEIRWNDVAGASYFTVYDENTYGAGWLKLYEGSDNVFQTTEAAEWSYFVEIYFDSVDLKSTAETAINVGV